MVNKALILGLFLLAMMLLALPGVITGIVFGLTAGMFAGLLAVSAWCVVAAGTVAFLCRNILDIAELNNR